MWHPLLQEDSVRAAHRTSLASGIIARRAQQEVARPLQAATDAVGWTAEKSLPTPRASRTAAHHSAVRFVRCVLHEILTLSLKSSICWSCCHCKAGLEFLKHTRLEQAEGSHNS